MQSVMTHQFSRVPNTNIPRSSFDRSHGLKTTFDGGKLVPVLVDEVLPGDSYNVKMNGFARLATPIHPIMDNMFMDTFFFFVPYRLVWDNFKKFMGEQTNPNDSTDYTIPVRSTTPSTGTLVDYMGVPIGNSVSVSTLPFRAYWLIYDEWFRDQNLQESAQIVKDDTNGIVQNAQIDWATLANRGKRHDYFTSALPWPQKGDSVEIPLLGNAPISGLGVGTGASDGPIGNVNTSMGVESFVGGYNSSTTNFLMRSGTHVDDQPDVYADLSQASSATINQLRQAFQIQKLLETDARSGTRYVEVIKAHFGIYNAGGDARLQRPEYLGGGSTPINITPIAQTSETGTTAQGSLAAMGTASINGHGFSKSFTEHGIIIGLVSARADLTYQQGLNRMWSRSTKYDFYWPSLANIGEQAILNKEIFVSGSQGDEEVFGYQERFAEYRYKPSQITGLFRSDAANSLDAWHLSQDFATTPQLNSDFIEEDVPLDRVIAVPSEPHFIADFYFNMRCARPMPLYGIPSFGTKF